MPHPLLEFSPGLMIHMLALPFSDLNYMKRQRNRHIKWVNSLTSVVAANVHEKRLFVSQMIIVFKTVVNQTRTYFALLLLHVVCDFIFTPLSPHEVSPNCTISWSIWVLIVSTDVIHSNKHFTLLSVPPTSTLDNLTNTCEVIASTNMKLKVVTSSFWLSPFIFRVENFVKFLH